MGFFVVVNSQMGLCGFSEVVIFIYNIMNGFELVSFDVF